MIGRLKGIVDELGEDFAVIDVNGVGYHVSCSARTLSGLPARGEPASLFTEMLVSENAIRLIGFASRPERDWFRLLDNVQGVGAKVALAILSALSAGELSTAVAMGDKAMVGRASGVGPKLAQRIVTELRDKAPLVAGGEPALAALSAQLEASRPTAAADAVSALVNLGYNHSQAGTAVAAAMVKAGDDATPEAIIRLALKELSR
jgi:Holliday junction DNA helicase RuvA